MDDLISRQAVISVLNNLARVNFTLLDGYQYYIGALHDASDDIKKLPTIEPKKGRWDVSDRKDVPYGLMCKCSNCGWEEHTNIMLGYNFCPNCGADMRGSET